MSVSCRLHPWHLPTNSPAFWINKSPGGTCGPKNKRPGLFVRLKGAIKVQDLMHKHIRKTPQSRNNLGKDSWTYWELMVWQTTYQKLIAFRTYGTYLFQCFFECLFRVRIPSLWLFYLLHAYWTSVVLTTLFYFCCVWESYLASLCLSGLFSAPTSTTRTFQVLKSSSDACKIRV